MDGDFNLNILFVGHDLKFIDFYIRYLQKSEHNIKIDLWEGHVTHNIKKSFEFIDWADIIFCEWGLGNAVFYSKNKKSNQKLIVRLHRQELETDYLKHVKIENIDKLITVSPYIYEEFCRTFKLPREKMNLVYNNIDLIKFVNANNENRKFHIGMVGYLPKLKRLDLALDIFSELYEKDSRYYLHFKGKRPEDLKWLWRNDNEREFYITQFQRIKNAEWKDNVIFEPFGNVVEFYNRMEFILSVSDVESFHLAAAEGMACGAIPIITNWEGSDTIYSKEYILNDVEDVENYIVNKRDNRDYILADMEKSVQRFDVNYIQGKLDSILLAERE